jgi:hypothetical protein
MTWPCSHTAGQDQEPRHETELPVREDLGRLTQRFGAQAEVKTEPEIPGGGLGRPWGLNAGLLVIGRGSATGDFGRLRSNAYALVREAPCALESV